jgi:hypothetical protein
MVHVGEVLQDGMVITIYCRAVPGRTPWKSAWRAPDMVPTCLHCIVHSMRDEPRQGTFEPCEVER